MNFPSENSSMEKPDYGFVGGVEKGYSAPEQLRNIDVVIVGGGPCGMFAAAVLHWYGISTTVIEREEKDPHIEISRAYLFSLNQRGQAIVREKPKLLDVLKKGCAAPDGYSSCSITQEGLVSLNTGLLLSKKLKPGMLFFRPRFIQEMRTFVANECSSARVLYGAHIQKISFSSEGHTEIQVKDPDGKCQTLQPKLVLACDGVNSVVVNALRNAPSDVVKSSRGFGKMVINYDSAINRNVRSMVMKEEGISHIEGMPQPLQKYWVKAKGKKFDLHSLPMLPIDKERIGGRLVSVVLSSGHPLDHTKDVENAFSAMEQNFPQIRIRENISEESMRSFIQGRAVIIGDITRVNSLAARIGRDGGVALFGDAAHSLPPDSGQGLNSAFEDIAEFAATLATAQKNASAQDVVTNYEKRRDEDIFGLLGLADVSMRNVKRREKSGKSGKLLLRADFYLRENLSTLFPSLIYPPVHAMNSMGWRYSISFRRQKITTWRLIILISLSCLLISWVVWMMVRITFRVLVTQ